METQVLPTGQHYPEGFTPDQVAAAIQQERARRGYPSLEKTKTERELHLLLDPNAPDVPHVNKFYSLVGGSGIHQELANIADPIIYYRLRRTVSDLFCVGSWDADEYFEQRQIRFLSELLLTKSIGWTKNSRERDAINEFRQTNTIRDDRPQMPRESPGFFHGFFNR
jgi:hypothetical protein